MKVLFPIIFFSLICIKPSAQTIASMSATICDSIKKIEELDENELRHAQLSIYHREMVKYPTLKVDITGLNRPRQFNEYNYKINRQLLKTCPEFIDQFSLLPLSKILDVEGLFNREQYDSLESAIVEFIYLKKIDLVVITMDEVEPYQNLDEFADAQLHKLKVGARYEQGGILIVISKELNDAHIALTGSTQKFISESDCNEFLPSDLSPVTSYFKLVFNCIMDFKKKT